MMVSSARPRAPSRACPTWSSKRGGRSRVTPTSAAGTQAWLQLTKELGSRFRGNERRQAMKQYLLGRLAEFPEGRGRAFQAGARTVAVFRTNGKIYAVANRCIHKGASICDGDLAENGKVVRCPWHNWSFDLATGEHCLDRTEKLRTYEVRM